MRRSVRRGLPTWSPSRRSPVRLVASLGFGEREQDRLLLAGAAFGEIPVDGSLGPLVGKVLAPPPDVGPVRDVAVASRSRCGHAFLRSDPVARWRRLSLSPPR
ncbi:MAG: hypothetical protein WKF83_02875 [Nocardioidaceae bacterium]